MTNSQTYGAALKQRRGKRRMRPRLRLFNGEDDGFTAVADSTVSMTFGELSRIMRDAGLFERTWLTDFEDEQVQVPEDLYEVLTSYWQLRPGA